MITDSECQRRCREAERAALERAAQVAEPKTKAVEALMNNLIVHAMDYRALRDEEDLNEWRTKLDMLRTQFRAAIRALIGVPHTGEGG